MEEKYIIFRNLPLLYMLKKEIAQQLEKHNIITIYDFSYAELVNNNVKTFYTSNNKFEERKYPRSTWCRYNKKCKQYITFDTYELLYNNYFYIKDNNVIQFNNIKDHINELKQLIFVLSHDNCMYTVNNTFQYLKNNNLLKFENNIIICDCIKFVKTYRAIADYPLWFIDNNENINYNNKENLLNIQKYLINGGNIRDITPDSNLCVKWWLARGWDENYAKQKISEFQSKNALKYSNKRKQNPEQYKDVNSNQIGYWLKRGYSEEEAKEKVKERQQTFTLEKCIQKYGEIEGRKRFEERQKKWQNTLQSKDDYIEVVIKRCSHSSYSNISQELFDKLYKLLQDNNINCDVYYHNLNHEWGFGIKKHGGVLYDFVIPELKYAIEFNGNRFHPNKEKLSKEEFKNWTNPWGKTAKEQYKFDKFKNNAIIKKGFTLDIIWEDEYLENKDKILNIILNRIKQIYNGTKIS